MPEKQQRNRKRRPWTLKRFWDEWGIFAIIVVAIVGVLVGVRLAGKTGEARQVENSPAYRIYFTQGTAGTQAPDGIEAEIVKDLAAAKTYVQVASPALDLEQLTAELVSLKTNGIEVQVVEEAARQGDPGVQAATKKLQDAGIQVVLRDAEGKLAEAFVVVDGRVAWAGSWELTKTALTVDASYVMRWQVLAVANNFHVKFDDMFTRKAFGKSTTVKTPATHMGFLNGDQPGTVDMYMTPEDDPWSQVLQAMHNVQGEQVILTERFDDQRLLDRFMGESTKPGVTSSSIIDRSNLAGPMVLAMQETIAHVAGYAGSGKLGENAILLDQDYVMLFSQPLVQQGFEQNDGFVIIVRDKTLRSAFAAELMRLLSAPEAQPPNLY